MKAMRKLNDIFNEFHQFNLWDASALLCYRGSIAHGTYIPNQNPHSVDDQDVIGVAIPTAEYCYGLRGFEQFEMQRDGWDVLVYDFRKFIRLLIKSNPNVLQVLWTKDEHFLKKTWQGELLLQKRGLFVNRAIYNSFCGYGYGQLHKMENMAYNGYMGEKRKALVKEFGYDCKNAQHLIRLLRQGIEFLKTGELVVERPDRAELIEIKTGKWSIEKVKRVANDLFREMENAFKNSPLPENPDFEAVNELVVEILQKTYSGIPVKGVAKA